MRFYEFLERVISNATIDETSALVGMICNKDIAGILFKGDASYAITMSAKKEGGYYILKKFDVSTDMKLTFRSACVFPEDHRQRFKDLIHARMEIFNNHPECKSENPSAYMNWDGSWMNVLPKADVESFGMSLIDGAKEQDDKVELY